METPAGITLQTTDGETFLFPCTDFEQPCSILFNIAAEQFGYKKKTIKLTFAGKELEKDKPLYTYSITKHSKILCAGMKAEESKKCHIPWVAILATILFFVLLFYPSRL